MLALYVIYQSCSSVYEKNRILQLQQKKDCLVLQAVEALMCLNRYKSLSLLKVTDGYCAEVRAVF